MTIEEDGHLCLHLVDVDFEYSDAARLCVGDSVPLSWFNHEARVAASFARKARDLATFFRVGSALPVRGRTMHGQDL